MVMSFLYVKDLALKHNTHLIKVDKIGVIEAATTYPLKYLLYGCLNFFKTLPSSLSSEF